jgi:hypothetical protein
MPLSAVSVPAILGIAGTFDNISTFVFREASLRQLAALDLSESSATPSQLIGKLCKVAQRCVAYLDWLSPKSDETDWLQCYYARKNVVTLNFFVFNVRIK